MKFTVFYKRPGFIPHGMMGYQWLKERNMVPTVDTLEISHIRLKEVEAKDLEDLFGKMQGEIWSPNGEARPMIRILGLQHTSMSVGDIARYEEDGVFVNDPVNGNDQETVVVPAGGLFMCDNVGWVFLGPEKE